MKRIAVINVVGLSSRHIGEHTPFLSSFAQTRTVQPIRPAFPAVTCTAQSDYLTGKRPSEHGIVANGWYERDLNEVHFWKQSNRLVQAPKIWDILRKRDPHFTCANLFWWYNMATTADIAITPRPIYRADGGKIFDITSSPLAVRDEIKRDLGTFPFHSFWGPMAGIASSQWIAQAALWTEHKYHPTLQLIYLPHLDYNMQRLGPNDPRIATDLQAIDAVIKELVQGLQASGIEPLILSEYAITPVSRPVHLNRLFRQRGWISIKDEAGCEQLDFATSQVFAVADHQVAHIYLNSPQLLPEVAELLRNTEGIAKVFHGDELEDAGLRHSRSGDLVVEATPESWFTYYYWLDDKVAPDFARTVDIHRKIGYDPVELFIDPAIGLPKLKLASFLLRKKLGFRALMDVIPLDASLVKGSHGHRPDSDLDWPILISPSENARQKLDSTDLLEVLLRAIDPQ